MTGGANETRASFTATCRYCDRVVLTAPQILTAELVKLSKHLRDHHPGGFDKQDHARGLSGLVSYFVVEQYPVSPVKHSPRH
jgi:glycerol-3-phosphate cytidylyltransferase-like family protein